jgi:Ca2+-binding RTX toxin-like protein
MLKRLLTLLTITAAVAGLPAVASAATVSRAGDGTLVYTAAAGETNHLQVQAGYDDGTTVLYETTATITSVPSGCTNEDDFGSAAVTCPTPPSVSVDLGDGDDSLLDTAYLTVPVTAYGGAGNDVMHGSDVADVFDGGPGNDTIDGFGGNDTLLGGDGDDVVEGGAGSDHLEGGTGDDTLRPDGHEDPSPDYVDGGPGIDRIDDDYTADDVDADRQPSVAFTLAGAADDGRPGEGDDIVNVEQLVLNNGGSVAGTSAPELLEFDNVGKPVNVDAGAGDDTILSGDGNDTITGGPGNDYIDGGFGDDVINPGPGQDVVFADKRAGDCGPLWCRYPYGNDTVDARDGEVDQIHCGFGTDTVYADPQDVVDSDCETVIRSTARPSTNSAGGSTPGSASSGPGAGVGSGTKSAGHSQTLHLHLTPMRLQRALAHGLRVTVTNAKPGSPMTVVAKRHGAVVARGSARVAKNGECLVVVRFTASAKRALRSVRNARLVLSASHASIVVMLHRR